LTGSRKLILTLVTLTLIAITGWAAGSPEWSAEWLVWALGVGTGGNALEHLSGAFPRRRARLTPAAGEAPIPASSTPAAEVEASL